MTNTYTNVDHIKVAPGIGVARVGNASGTGSDSYFLGPEVPGKIRNDVPETPATYKNSSGEMKRQAQRFKAFAYGVGGDFLGEVTHGDSVNGQTVTLEWDVHVRNLKCANYAFQGKYVFDPSFKRNSTIQPHLEPDQRDKLIIDPGLKTVSGASAAPVELIDLPVAEGGTGGSTIFDIDTPQMISGRLFYDPPQPYSPDDNAVQVTYTAASVSLGHISTDADGRLIFQGGSGRSESCTSPKVVVSKVPPADTAPEISLDPQYNGNSYFNNPGWFDDTCGGSINVKVMAGNTALFDTSQTAAYQGWVAVAPPHYAPATYNVVSLLDLQLDMYPEADPYTGKGPLQFIVARTLIDSQYGGGIEIATYDSKNADPQFVGVAVSGLGTDAPIEETSFTNISASYFEGNVYTTMTSYSGSPYFGTLSGTSLNINSAADFGPAGDIARIGQLVPYEGNLWATAINDENFVYASLTFDFGSIFVNGGASVPAISGAPLNVDVVPSAVAYNGLFHIGAVDANNNFQIATARSLIDGDAPFTVAFLEDETGAKITCSPAIAPTMAYHRGQLYVLYIDDATSDLRAAISLDGNTFKVSTVQQSLSFLEGSQLSASSFNGTLFITYTVPNGTTTLTTIDGSLDGEVQQFGASGQGALCTNVPVQFYRDIYPTLKTVVDYAWTNERAFHGHRPGASGDFLNDQYLPGLANPRASPEVGITNGQLGGNTQKTDARSFVFKFIRPRAQDTYIKDAQGNLQPYTIPPPGPNGKVNGPIYAGEDVQQRADLMPRLFGNGGSPSENTANATNHPNQWLPLTDHMLEKIQHWVNGNFIEDAPENVADQYTKDGSGNALPEPDQMSIAALQPTVGGGFHPGIELTYLMHETAFFDSAFRFKSGTPVGGIAAYMSVPWQGDFWSCNISWWPALRPDIAVTSDRPFQAVDTGPTPANDTPVLNYQPWFRGPRIPPNSDATDGYQGGYAVMLDEWHRFGLVTPQYDLIDQGETPQLETERDPTLNDPSVIFSVTDAYVVEPYVIEVSDSTVVRAQPNNLASQNWHLFTTTPSDTTTIIQPAGSTDALTVDFATGAVSIAPLITPYDASQLWEYTPTGYPTVITFTSKINLQNLAVNTATGAISTVASAGQNELVNWTLKEGSSTG